MVKIIGRIDPVKVKKGLQAIAIQRLEKERKQEVNTNDNFQNHQLQKEQACNAS